MNVRYSVPANLLIAGEYLITRAGGTGIALATAPRAFCTITGEASRQALQMYGDAQNTPPPISVQAITTHRVSCAPRLVNAVCREVARSLAVGTPGDLRELNDPVVTINTSSFFDSETGQKQGLGSSAAASVLLTAAVLHLAGLDPERNLDEVIRISLAAHRALQGGRGSGYDLVTSATGGLIRFEGATLPRTPRWSAPREHVLPSGRSVRAYTWSTGRSVSSADAVEAFERAYPPGPAADRMLMRNNTAVTALGAAGTWQAFRDALEQAQSLSAEIGARIGFPADLPGVHRYRDTEWVIKASGAGNERGLLFTTPSQDPETALRQAGVSACDRTSLRELLPERVGLSVDMAPKERNTA